MERRKGESEENMSEIYTKEIRHEQMKEGNK